MKTKLYILGANGFIGKHITEYFSNNENYELQLISRASNLFSSGEQDYLDIYNSNLYFEDQSIIIHLARSEKDFAENEIQLRDKILKSNPIFIGVFSSAVIYTSGTSPYKEEKKSFENIWGNTKNTCIFRLFNCFGEYQIPFRKGSLIANILYKACKGEEIDINDIDQKRDFIYAGDIGKIIQYFIEKKSFGIKDIGNKTISINDLLTIINGFTKLSINNLKKKEPSFDKLPQLEYKIELGSINEDLKKTYDFIRNNINIYNKIINESNI